MLAEYLGVLVIFAIALVVAGTLLARGKSIAPGRGSDEKQAARTRSAAALHPGALLFLTAGVAAVFVYPFAASFRTLGLPALVVLGLFCLPLGVGFAYLWRRGASQW